MFFVCFWFVYLFVCLLLLFFCFVCVCVCLCPGKYEHISISSLPPLWLAYLGDPSDSGRLTTTLFFVGVCPVLIVLQAPMSITAVSGGKMLYPATLKYDNTF